MKLREIMTSQVQTVQPQTTLQVAAELMRRGDLGMLPVVDRGEIVGTVTDRDIAVRGIADGLDPAQEPVSSVMTPDAVFVYEDQLLEDAAHIMKEERVRRLLVLNREGELVGVVSLGDIALAAGEQNLGAEVLVEVSRPHRLRLTRPKGRHQ